MPHTAQPEPRSIPDSCGIGVRIRFMRRQRAMSLEELAGAAGLTKSFLSKLERGLSVPSIATALKLAASFGVSVGALLGEEEGSETVCIVRKGERRAFMRAGSGYNYEMQPFVMRPPFEFQNDRLFDHVGEEFILVLSGAIEVEFPNRRVKLKARDSLYFDSHLPHRSRSLGQALAEALVVVTGHQRR
jgi:transcriptional regulator with XRE-family HTH domain